MEQEGVSSYRETQIKTASKGALIVLLYDGLIRFIDIALEKLPEKRFDLVNENVLKAQDILSELILALNFDAGDISHKLFNIYTFLNTKLIEGNVQKKAAPLKFVRSMACELREAWSKVAKKGGTPGMKEMEKEGGIDIAG